MKIRILLIISLCCFIQSIYADSISDLLEQAKKAYQAKNIDQTLQYLELAKSEISRIKLNESSSKFEIVEFSRIKNFPSRYTGKKIKVPNTAIASSNIGKKFGDVYRITVSTVNQSSSFYNEPFDSGSLFFTISEALLEKLIDAVPAGYVGYFNVYTDEIYTYTKKEAYTEDRIYYVANIKGLEKINYDTLSGDTFATDEFLSE